MKMTIEYSMEKYCPLESQFSLGTVFQLEYPITRTDCPLCGKEVSRFYTDKKSSTVILTDVRYNGGPAKLKILRQEGICPFCKQRLPAEEIPNVQVELKWGLTIRLIRMITKHCVEEGIWEQARRKVAEGYGISLPVVKKYVSKTCEDVRKTAEQLLAYEMSKPHDSRSKQLCSVTGRNLRYYEVPMTEYPLKLYFTWPMSGRTTEDIVLWAAFGTETDILSSWMQGDFRKRNIGSEFFGHIKELAKWSEERQMMQIRKITKRILRFCDSQLVVTDTFGSEADTAGMERARQVALVIESAIEENRQQWGIEKNENPFALPTRLLYLNSTALLCYPDGSLPILEDGSIDPGYIRLSGISAEELLTQIDNGLLSRVKRHIEVEV